MGTTPLESTDSLIEQLLEREEPHTLQDWCFQTIVASYPQQRVLVVWGATLMYLGWLDELEEVLVCH